MWWSSVQSSAHHWPAAAGPRGQSRMATRGVIANMHLSQQRRTSRGRTELVWKGPRNRMGGLQGKTRPPLGRVACVSHERPLQRLNSPQGSKVPPQYARGIRRVGSGCSEQRSRGGGRGPGRHPSTNTTPEGKTRPLLFTPPQSHPRLAPLWEKEGSSVPCSACMAGRR